MTDLEHLLTKMLITSTGTAMMDSGGDDGRQWQRIRKEIGMPFDAKVTEKWITKAYQFYREQPREWVDKWELDHAESKEISSEELCPTVSTFHYLNEALELDELCNDFNRLPCKDWDGDTYGISVAQSRWLERHGLSIRLDEQGWAKESWNSYNGESSLDHTLQGTFLHLYGNESNFEYPDYVLLQIHQGADVRGGYTDAKLFKLAEDYLDTNPSAYFDVDGVELSTSYNGYNLTDDNGVAVDVSVESMRQYAYEGV